MKTTGHKAVTSAVFAVGVIVALVVAGVAGYYAGTSTATGGAMTETKTAAPVTVTQTVGAGATATVTSTVTATATGTGSGNQGPYDTQYLINQCKAEGATATINNVWDSSAYPTLQKYLTAQYPWFTANLVSFAPGDLVNKATSEFTSGHVTSDVLHNTYADWIEMNATTKGTMFQPFYDPNPFYLNETATGVLGGQTKGTYYGYQTSYDPILIVYNKNLVPANQAPTSIQDLANPAFKGKIVFDNPALLNVAGALFASYEPSMGNASWTSLMKGIAANNPILTSDAGVSASDIVTGQAEIGVALMDDYAYNLGNGAPIAVVPTSTIYVLNAPISLAKGAPHPACGQLFIDWETSYVGNIALQLTARPSYIPFISSSFYASVNIPTNGVQFLPQATGAPTYFTDTAGWAGYFASIFGKP